MAMEFLNKFQGDEDAFLKAYRGAACEGHTKLLKAILGVGARLPLSPTTCGPLKTTCIILDAPWLSFLVIFSHLSTFYVRFI
ncbi:hypothetical protein EV401DRAFT_2075060 [Pisolithus croceorrhizus]|nr:hypothetical protein EV401DRAFT_2075060 [Pisolithus croceorrhizus]